MSARATRLTGLYAMIAALAAVVLSPHHLGIARARLCDLRAGVRLLLPAVLLCAWAVRARRSPAGHNERWGWRIALVGYGLASVGLVAAFFVLITGSTAGDALARLRPSSPE